MRGWRGRIATALLRVYPREFREQYAASMADHIHAEDDNRETFARTLFDMFVTSVVMRFDDLRQDISYAVRMDMKAPLFTFVVIATMALAIATNTVVFALLDAVLLKPLPFTAPEQLGILWSQMPQSNGLTFTTVGNKQADAIASASKTFSTVTYAMSPDTVSVPGGTTLHRVQVKTNYFTALGIRPVLGTFLTDAPPAHQAVISFALWQAKYGGSADVLGQQIKLQDVAYTIVGVAPAEMRDPTLGGLAQDDVWTKIPVFDADTMVPVFPIARLRPGVTWQGAHADLARVQRLLKGNNSTHGSTLNAGPLLDTIFTFARSFLWLVFAAVTGVLLIACANVANLLLARGAVRESEFGIRSALGATAARLARQVLTETLLLAAIGAVLGVVIAWLVLPAARAVMPGNMPRVQSAGIDTSVLLYVLGLIVAVTLLTGIAPAYRRAKKGRRDAAVRLRSALVVAEIAIAFALTAAFGVMLHSFLAMTNVPLGFDPRGVYVANLRPTHDALFSVKLAPSAPSAIPAASIESKIRAIPGVEDASMATGTPFNNSFMMRIALSSGWDGRKNGQPLIVASTEVGTRYFSVLRIPIVAGHAFASSDFARNTGSVMVNQAFVRAYFPHGNVVGKLIRMPKVNWHVVGVVADTRSSFKGKPEPMLYMPFNGGFGPYFGVVLRTAHPVPSLAKDVTQVLRSASAMPAAVAVRSLSDLMAEDASSMRTSLQLLGALAAVALLLGLCGIYSVVAYGTERRFHEIGIRMAVGARPWNIVSLVVSGALLQSAIGVAFGLVLCALTTRLLATQLYKTSPLDPPALIAVVAVVIACAGCASLIPAIRAAFARPSVTLRYE